MRQRLGAGSAERVGHDVVDAGDVLGDDREVVPGGQLVQGAQDGEDGRAAGRLPVDDGDVALVVDEQLDDRVSKGRTVGGDGVQSGEGLKQANVVVREVALMTGRPGTGEGDARGGRATGREVEAEALERSVGAELEDSAVVAPRLAAVPGAEVAKPAAEVEAEAVGHREPLVAVAAPERVDDAAQEGTGSWQHLGGEVELARQRHDVLGLAGGAREERAAEGDDLGLALRREGEGLGPRVEEHAKEGDLLRGVHGLVVADRQTEGRVHVQGGGQRLLEAVLGLGEVEHVIDVAAVLDAATPEVEADDGEEQLAEAGRRGQAEGHALELVGLALEREAQMLAELRLDIEGQEAVGKVGLAEPAARGAVGQRVVDALVADLVLRQVVVEVARQVQHQARLAAVLDDDVKRLETVVVLLLANGGESAEVAVVVDALLDEDALAGDGRRVLEANGRRDGQQFRVDTAPEELRSFGELGHLGGVLGCKGIDDVEPIRQAALDCGCGQSRGTHR